MLYINPLLYNANVVHQVLMTTFYDVKCWTCKAHRFLESLVIRFFTLNFKPHFSPSKSLYNLIFNRYLLSIYYIYARKCYVLGTPRATRLDICPCPLEMLEFCRKSMWTPPFSCGTIASCTNSLSTFLSCFCLIISFFLLLPETLQTSKLFWNQFRPFLKKIMN